MVETITPVVHGGRNRRYWTSVILHVLAATATAATFGALLGLIGGLLGAPWGNVGLVVVIVAAVAYAARELIGAPIPVPDRRRQVPEWWRTFYSAPVAAMLYGAGLGIGFLTFLTYGTYVAVVVGAFVSGEPVQGALITAAFGLARSVSVLISARSVTGELASGVVDRLQDVAGTARPRTVNGVVLVGVAAGALAMLLA
jgi:hypothetical protein